jgi:hypothetical protein
LYITKLSNNNSLPHIIRSWRKVCEQFNRISKYTITDVDNILVFDITVGPRIPPPEESKAATGYKKC